jgi:hypothetical protein
VLSKDPVRMSPPSVLKERATISAEWPYKVAVYDTFEVRKKKNEHQNIRIVITTTTTIIIIIIMRSEIIAQ